MSKEIIIDGVNVAGCVQLVEEPFYPCGLGGECKGWENCYYKQLKRLEQENAELKEKIKKYSAINEQETKDYAELKAENECLKQEFEIESLTDKTTGETIYRSNLVNKLKELLKVRIENLCESCGASSMMPMPCTVYKQTLQEIKAIAEDNIDCKQYEIDHDCFNDTRCKALRELIETLKQILDLITKPEEE